MTRRGSLLLAVALIFAVTACAETEPDPAVVRQERIEARLGDTFSSSQATCIADALDPAALVALDRSADLETDSPEMTTYTEAVVECTADP